MTCPAAVEHLRVLMVDDNEDDVALVRLLTTKARLVRIKLDAEAGAERALERLLPGGYDVCLLDFALGQASGLDVLAQLRAVGCEVPVVMVTGTDDERLHVSAIQAGAADFLAKRDLSAPLIERVLRYTASNHRLVSQLRADAERDELTGATNRRAFRRRVAALLQPDARTRFAVLYLDLDRFKRVNDRHGHEVGDEVLREVASRVMGCIRDNDTLARLGGDEFAVLLPGCASIDVVRKTVARRIVQSLERPYELASGVVAELGVSIGLVHSDVVHAPGVDALLQLADQAMYTAKRRGGSLVSVGPA